MIACNWKPFSINQLIKNNNDILDFNILNEFYRKSGLGKRTYGKLLYYIGNKR